jgi:hypothetical protein
LHCPDSAQRHQALFSLGALLAFVACLDLASGLFRPVAAEAAPARLLAATISFLKTLAGHFSVAAKSPAAKYYFVQQSSVEKRS